MDKQTPTVTIGDREVGIRPLNGRRAIIAGKLLTEIVREGGDLVSDYVKFAAEYREHNTEQYSPARYELRARVLERAQRDVLTTAVRAEHEDWSDDQISEEVERLFVEEPRIPEEDWERSGNTIPMPNDPSPAEVAALFVPRLFASAEDKVGLLLAVLVTPNSEVKEARREGKLDELLAERADGLLDDADIGELAELLTVGIGVVEEALRGKLQPLGQKIGALLGGRSPQTPTEPTEATKDGTSSGSTSSTDSPPPTDGRKSEPSTTPSGTTSAASPSA